MNEDCVAKRIFGHKERETHLRARSHSVSRHKIAGLIQVAVIKREHSGSLLVLPPAMLFASAACKHAFGAPAPKRNLPGGTVVFCLRLGGLWGTGEEAGLESL